VRSNRNARPGMARPALGWTVRDLASATGLHRNTNTNIEVGRYAGDEETLRLIKSVLENQGIVFIEANVGAGPAFDFANPSRARLPASMGRLRTRFGLSKGAGAGLHGPASSANGREGDGGLVLGPLIDPARRNNSRIDRAPSLIWASRRGSEKLLCG
jgi:DNA-binding XRE family transcriptional regulator